MRRAIVLLSLLLLLAACSEADSSEQATPTRPADQGTPATKPAGKVVTEIESLATPTPVTPTPTPVPPTPTPLPFARLELLSHRTYSDRIGSLWVVGEAKNTGDTTADGVEVTVSLLGADDKPLATTYATVHLAEVPPEGKTPFRAMFAQPPAEWKAVRVELTAAAADPLEKSPFVAGLKVGRAEVTASSSAGGAVVAGEVRNDGQEPALMVQLIAALYGPDGKVVDVVGGYARLPELAPGASSPFSLQFLEAKEPGPVDVFAQGRSKPGAE